MGPIPYPPLLFTSLPYKSNLAARKGVPLLYLRLDIGFQIFFVVFLGGVIWRSSGTDQYVGLVSGSSREPP